MSTAEPLARIRVGVVVERRKAKSAWADFLWRPISVLAGEPDAAPWTLLDSDADCATFYVGTAEIDLYRSDCGFYRDNLAAEAPKLWAALRATGADPPFAIVTVTADPSEGEALATSGTDLVEALPMPPSIHSAIAAFVAEYHVEDASFSKRVRDRADPEALARRAPVKGPR
jgi:hypothetical protein